MIYLAVAGAVNSVISLFNYFRIGRAIFMEEQDPPSGYVRAVILLSTIVILLLGVHPGPLSELAMAFSLN
jgi:NADH:ubiquinone oxidoreductase subunit 2 (subunit N)